MIRGWHVAVATFLSIALVVSLAIAGDVRVAGGLVVSNPPGVDSFGNVGFTGPFAQSGLLRFPNNVTMIAARNAGNTADIAVLKTDASNVLTMGDANTNATVVQAVSNVNVMTTGGVTLTVAAAGLSFNASSFQFSTPSSAPTITQAALTTASGTGNTLLIQAQNETGTTSVGGAAILSGGTGTSANGPSGLGVGGTAEFIVGAQATGGGPAGITYANTNNFSITAAVNTTFTPTPAQYVNPLFTLTGTLSAAAIATIALPVTGGVIWKFDISQVVFTSGTIKWTCGGGTASAGISSLTTTSEIVDVICNGSRVAINQ